MPEFIVVDLDDFTDQTAAWTLPLLDQLYRQSGGRFKATLFCIPSQTSDAVLHAAAGRSWIELAGHGWDHTPQECLAWDALRTREVLGATLSKGCISDEDSPLFKAVFKPPYWQASPAVYVTLQEAGWVLADHPRNCHRISPAARQYVLSPIHGIGTPHLVLPVVQAHGHCNEVEGNGLRGNFQKFADLAQWDLPYAFVSEVAI